MISVKSSISLLVRIWKISHPDVVLYIYVMNGVFASKTQVFIIILIIVSITKIFWIEIGFMHA